MTALFSFTDFHHRRSGPRSAPFAAAILVFATASMASAQQSFKSAGEAADALAGAARTGNQRSILAVVGQPGADVVSSGDEVADTATLKSFLAAYDTKHRVVVEANKATMLVGDEDFPFPIPIVRSGQTWRFDTAAGRLEVLYRRIGRNELDVIQVCLAYVDAQDEYADKDRTGAGPGLYAQHFVSQPGKKDGLYWPDSSGNDPSPLGELVAQATGEGYRIGAGRTPFHGYYYKILTKQGSTAPGGALDYVVNGKMLGGFGLVAYPAEYGNSGVMTFLVNYNGVIFQKDLGPRTSWRAERITSFNPDQTWKKVAPGISP